MGDTPQLEIPNFRLIRHIGDGGMGSVYLARQQRPARDVVVKIVAPDPKVPAALMEMLKQEGDVAAQFQHPNLVTIFECGIVDQHYYIAMEYLPGGDLFQHNTDHGIEPRQAADWIRQVALGLNQIHDRGYVHRDIKPANVLFSSDDRPILTDFGIAKVVGPDGLLTQMGYTTGTPAYMSPEQIRGQELDGRSDLYSLGVVFYELLTGKRPFESSNDFEIREMQVRTAPPPLPPHLVDWQPVMNRLLAKSRDDRFDDARQLSDAIQDTLSHDRHAQPATELTPLPARPMAEEEARLPRRIAGPPRIPWLAIGVGLVLIAALAWWRPWQQAGKSPQAPSTGTSIAVLPFVNMSPDPDNEYFSDGIAEEILNTLVQIEDLRVAARTASFRFRNHDGDPQAVGEALKVDYILEGSVRRADRQVRITANLVQARDGFNLWSNRYDRTLDDIFALQTEIATEIAQAMQVTLAPDRAAALTLPTENPQAYELYIRGRHLWRQRNGQALTEAVVQLHRAVELDPGFAEALANLAMALYILPSYAGGSESDNLPEVERYALAALEIKPDLAQAHTVLGKALEGQGQFAASELRYLQAIEADPESAVAHHWYAIMLHHVGRLAEGRHEIMTALQLDPANGSILAWAAISDLVAGDFDRCVERVDEATRIGFQYGYMIGPHCHIGLGQYQAAERERKAGLERLGTDVYYITLLYEALLDPRQTPRALAALQAIDEFAFLDGAYLFESYVLLGEFDAAVDFVLSVDEDFRDESMNVLWSPLFRKFRRSDAFRRYATEMRLVDYWRTSGWPAVCRPEGGGFECD